MSRRDRIMSHYQCSAEDAQRFIDLRDEGYSTYQSAVMSGLRDPDYFEPEDNQEQERCPNTDDMFGEDDASS